MTEWVAFDNQSIAVLQEKTQGDVYLAEGDALDAALSSDTPVIAMLPAAAPGRTLLLSVSRKSSAEAFAGATAAGQPREEGVSYVPTGFLGLSDVPVYDEEPQPKKSWWKRLTE